MKYITIFLILLTSFSCKSINNYYQGRVIDENNKPLVNVTVMELHNDEKRTQTDKNGYFTLNRDSEDWSGLIFSKDGYITDTIPIVWHQAGETTRYHFIQNDITIVKLTTAKEQLDLIVTQPKSGNRQISPTWNDLDAIQKNWIEVKKDEEGYLIYEPCDGDTRQISFKDGFLYIKWQLEPAYKFSYEKFTRRSGNKSFQLEAYEKETKTSSILMAEIVDYKNGLVMWNVNGEKWLMTPIENSEKFRHVKNNCPDYKRNEVTFAEVQ